MVPDLSRHTSELCGEFRKSWTTTTSGVSGVAEFIGRSGAVVGKCSRLAALIEIDMEQSWSHWADSALEQAQRDVLPDELVEQWKQLPRFQNYAVLFDGPQELAPYWAELAQVESSCRDRWGDAIGSKFYQQYFQVSTEEVIKRQRRHLRCEFEHNEDYSQILFPLRGRNEVGRQRTRDADPYFCEVNADGNRLVVASRYEAEVSREQLTLQLLTPAVAIVTNRSQVNSIRLASNQVLAPGSKACALFPFIIQIPGRRLVCY